MGGQEKGLKEQMDRGGMDRKENGELKEDMRRGAEEGWTSNE